MEKWKLDDPFARQLLEPVQAGESPCGPDLEYDERFLSLSRVASGKSETQFSPAIPPDWEIVRQLSEDLLRQSRDVRLAMLWLRAKVCCEGIEALPSGLQVLLSLIENFWDQLHPLPDPEDGEMYGRINALALLNEVDGVLGDLRDVPLITHESVGRIDVRMVELAVGSLSTRSGETAHSSELLLARVKNAVMEQPSIHEQLEWVASQFEVSLKRLDALVGVLNQRNIDASRLDLRTLRRSLETVARFLRGAMANAATGGGVESGTVDGALTAAAVPRLRSGFRFRDGVINSREDALLAIDLVCEFLERSEPANPAPLFLRRARKLMNQSFLQLIKELAPESLSQVAHAVGVNPDSVYFSDK